MSRRRKIFAIIISVVLVAALIFKDLLTSVFYTGLSYVTSPDLKYVRENTWSYRSGFKIGEGDFIMFEVGDLFQLRNDTICYEGSPRALVQRINKHFYEMTISSIDGKQKGYYANIEEFTR